MCRVWTFFVLAVIKSRIVTLFCARILQGTGTNICVTFISSASFLKAPVINCLLRYQDTIMLEFLFSLFRKILVWYLKRSRRLSFTFLGVFAQSRKAPVSFVMPLFPSVSVHQSVRVYTCTNAAPNERISLKFDVRIFVKICRVTPNLVTFRHLMWRPKTVLLLSAISEPHTSSL
jgi:hypothetical protein